ncbi:MAG: hypothetical protein J6125_00060 [Clostridia bacterium]|nr:hypothetical protein [Clostridia bacterium]
MNNTKVSFTPPPDKLPHPADDSGTVLGRRVAVAGADGVGMYGVARVALSRGVSVCGCDRHIGEYARRLRRLGCRITEGETPPLEGCSSVVYTAALAADHPVFAAAARLGLPLFSRAEALAALIAEMHPSVCVAGTHGKSTVTARLGHLFAAAGLDPLTVCGATPAAEGDPFRAGQGSAVLECCEYKRSFLSFHPDVALILNVEHDHTDCYPTLGDVRAAFSAFVCGSRAAVVPAAETWLIRAARANGVPCMTFSMSDPTADVSATDVYSGPDGHGMTVLLRGRPFCRVSLCLPGRCNLSNALAAVSVAITRRIPVSVIVPTLAAERGVRRRMEFRGRWRGAFCYDDYAHHPTEIRASLCAAREMTRGRLFCVFQSHTYTRTAAHLSEIGAALRLADHAYILPIYAARETDTLGMSEGRIAEATGPTAVAVPRMADLPALLAAHLREGDTLVVMGAGDVDRLFSMLL